MIDLGVTAFALYGGLLGYVVAHWLVRAGARPFGYDSDGAAARRLRFALWPIAAVALTLAIHRLAR